MPRLLTISHSYVVAQNRRLAHEMARAGGGEWQVTAAAPRRFAGDLRPVALEPLPGEACDVAPLDLWLASSPHLFLYRGLRSIMNRGWDVVHCWEEPYVAAGAQVAALAPRAARLVPATFQNMAKNYPPPFSSMERYVMRRADGWIAFGESIVDAQRPRAGYARRAVRVIPPGVDLQSFRPDGAARAAVRARLGWTDDAPVLGFVGRFVPQKGIALLLDVLPRLGADWRALFVGGGPMLGELLEFERRHPRRVHVLTAIAHDEVPAYLNAMDVLCAPSRTTPRWREQFGRMLIEAMACGVPVVASRSGEIPHVVGDVGIIVAEEDANAWLASLRALLADADTRRRLAAAGLDRVRSRYAWPVVARLHLAFFQELLSR